MDDWQSGYDDGQGERSNHPAVRPSVEMVDDYDAGDGRLLHAQEWNDESGLMMTTVHEGVLVLRLRNPDDLDPLTLSGCRVELEADTLPGHG